MTTILVVDDILPNRKLLVQMLGIKGYDTVEAENGVEALAKFDEVSPDLVLMDVNMPDMDGHEATRCLKESMGDNYVPVIFVTALSSSMSLRDALASGGDDFISKPVDSEILYSKINAHLRIRELSLDLNRKNAELKKHNQLLQYEQELVEYFFENALKHSYLPDELIRYHVSAASTFSGDILLSARTPADDVIVLVGDFTGHGLTAAMGTLPVAQIFFELAGAGCSVSELARKINTQLKMLMPLGMFLTAAIVHLDTSAGKISIWSGGMPNIYLFSVEGDLRDTLTSQHPAMGVLEDHEFSDVTKDYPVQSGDRLYICSDGVVEACDESGDMFGNERLKELLIDAGSDRFDHALQGVQAFQAGAGQEDDVTFVELACDFRPGESAR